MIRVLHSVSNMDRGGIETMLMNYYRHIDREKVQFDFIVNKQKPGDYDDEIRRLGGHIYQSPGLNPLHYPAYLRFVQQTVAADPRIRILHAHNEAMGLYALKGAEKAGLQVRIAHAHNIWIVRDYKWPLKMFCKQLLPGAATHLWAAAGMRASTTLAKRTGSAGDRSFPTPLSRRPSASPPPSAPKCGRATGWKTGWCWVM